MRNVKYTTGIKCNICKDELYFTTCVHDKVLSQLTDAERSVLSKSSLKSLLTVLEHIEDALRIDSNYVHGELSDKLQLAYAEEKAKRIKNEILQKNVMHEYVVKAKKLIVHKYYDKSTSVKDLGMTKECTCGNLGIIYDTFLSALHMYVDNLDTVTPMYYTLHFDTVIHKQSLGTLRNAVHVDYSLDPIKAPAKKKPVTKTRIQDLPFNERLIYALTKYAY